MDPLSDLLRVVRLDGAYFFPVEATSPWCVQSGPARELRPRIMPEAEHLISYHILLAGQCFGGLLGEDQVELVAGDVILFPQGDAHVMSSPRAGSLTPEVYTVAPGPYPETVRVGRQGAPDTSFMCGYLGFDRGPFNPLLSALPRRLHMRGLPQAWLDRFTEAVTAESRREEAGWHTVLTRLAELMFIEVLRRYLQELPAGQTGWLAGLQDEVVGRVLSLLHARPGHPWSLDELAHAVASSRSNVAKRFAEVVGQPPMQYLTQWRMQVAAARLTQSAAKVAVVGLEVGYDSEAAFSRAFKKATGMAPSAWRRRSKK
jgi:AraC-like DNA-binding protein